MVELIILLCALLFVVLTVIYASIIPNCGMTKLEENRFKDFRKRHFFAHVERVYPPECGYRLYAKALFSEDKEDITDYDFMIDNV